MNLKKTLSFKEQIERLKEHGKLVKRHTGCTSYDCKMAKQCSMKDVCYGRSKERL